MATGNPSEAAVEACSLARTLAIVGDRWTFFLLREALAGTTRFAEFRSTLGIASDILTARLSTLVDAGVLVRRAYRDPGQRARESYHLTDPGRELSLVLGALQQWGDEHAPCGIAPPVVHRTTAGRPVSVSFVDDRGVVLPPTDVHVERTTGSPGR